MTTIRGDLKAHENIQGGLDTRFVMSGNMTAGVVGTSDYNELENKPSIDGITLEGDIQGIDVGIYPRVNYSTQEQDTFIKWLDGKEIWRKTITASGLSPNPSDWVTISNISNVDTVISIKAVGRNSYTDYSYTAPYITATYDHTTGNVRYYFSEMHTSGSMTLYISIEYTKG